MKHQIGLIFALIVSASTSGAGLASVPIDSLYRGIGAPSAAEFSSWGSTRGGLQVAISGPVSATFIDSKFYMALRNVTGAPLYICGLPRHRLFLSNSAGTEIAPTDSPSLSEFGPFEDTIEIDPNVTWVDPDFYTLRSSYLKVPNDVAYVDYHADLDLGQKDFASCKQPTRLTLVSSNIGVTLR